MSDEETKNQNDPTILAMFEAGAHFGYSPSKRHPSMAGVMFGVKNRVELFDLEKTKAYLEKAEAFIENVGASGKQILFVSGKHEAKSPIIEQAAVLEAPCVAGRWLGGTLTNFVQLKTRIARLVDLRDKRAKGELAKYTKKERLLIDREIERLEEMFGGILPMKDLPGALFVIDSKKEKTAVAEARKTHIPVVAVVGSDCDLKGVEYPIPANDSSSSSIKYFVEKIARAYKMGKSRMIIPIAPEMVSKK
jgi:small subunit ribosomal protein S2